MQSLEFLRTTKFVCAGGVNSQKKLYAPVIIAQFFRLSFNEIIKIWPIDAQEL